mgnify:FL=1|tara:strand:+ start:556 stop:975 length:420 start_codon:yes stop_codon:yes gene_type:complete
MTNQLSREHRIKKNISNKKFGYQLASIFFIIVILRLFLFKSFFIIDYALSVLCLLLILISKFKTVYIIPIKFIWLKFSFYLAKILNPILLFIIYLICFIPIGVIYKIISKNNLKTKINKSSSSYWEKPDDKNINFEEQF